MEPIVEQDVWFANFPYEEDSSKSKPRPVVVIMKSDDELEVLSVKITSHKIRLKDKFDVAIFKWEEAELDNPSIARVAKTIVLKKEDFRYRIGKLHDDDWNNIIRKLKDWQRENN